MQENIVHNSLKALYSSVKYMSHTCYTSLVRPPTSLVRPLIAEKLKPGTKCTDDTIRQLWQIQLNSTIKECGI